MENFHFQNGKNFMLTLLVNLFVVYDTYGILKFELTP